MRGKERESEGMRGKGMRRVRGGGGEGKKGRVRGGDEEKLRAGERVTNKRHKNDYLPLIIKGERERRDRGRMGERERGGEGDREVEKTQVHIFITMYRTTVAMVICGQCSELRDKQAHNLHIPFLGVSVSQLSTAPVPPREHSPCNCKHRTGQW